MRWVISGVVFPKSIWMITKHAKKIWVGLWRHSSILKTVWNITHTRPPTYWRGSDFTLSLILRKTEGKKPYLHLTPRHHGSCVLGRKRRGEQLLEKPCRRWVDALAPFYRRRCRTERKRTIFRWWIIFPAVDIGIVIIEWERFQDFAI